jgi:hypothetical protein
MIPLLQPIMFFLRRNKIPIQTTAHAIQNNFTPHGHIFLKNKIAKYRPFDGD